VEPEKKPKLTPVADRRDFPRLRANFKVRCGVCGRHQPEVPGFTKNIGVGGIAFVIAATEAQINDHLAVEITVPGFDEPLYFLGTVVHVHEVDNGIEIGCRFDWLGKSDRYKEKLMALMEAHP